MINTMSCINLQGAILNDHADRRCEPLVSMRRRDLILSCESLTYDQVDSGVAFVAAPNGDAARVTEESTAIMKSHSKSDTCRNVTLLLKGVCKNENKYTRASVPDVNTPRPNNQ